MADRKKDGQHFTLADASELLARLYYRRNIGNIRK